MRLDVPREARVKRTVWHWKRAKWDAIRGDLRRRDWSFLEQDPIDDAAQKWTEIMLDSIDGHVPSVEITHSKPSHPWVNQRVKDAMMAKFAVDDTDAQAATTDECNRIIEEEYKKHMTNLKESMRKLPKNSKRWWAINRQLLRATAPKQGSPALRRPNGQSLGL